MAHFAHEPDAISYAALTRLLAEKERETDRRWAVELENRTRLFATCEALERKIPSWLDLEELGYGLLGALQKASGASTAILALVGADSPFLDVVASTVETVAPHQMEWIEEAFIVGESLRVDPREAAELSGPGNAELPSGLALCAEIIQDDDGTPLGVLYLERADEEPFDLSAIEPLLELSARAVADCRERLSEERLLLDAAGAMAAAEGPKAGARAWRVSTLALQLGRRLGLRLSELKAIELMGLLHALTPAEVRSALLEIKRGNGCERLWKRLHEPAGRARLYPSALPAFLRVIDDLPYLSAPYEAGGAARRMPPPLTARIVAVAAAYHRALETALAQDPRELAYAVVCEDAGRRFDPAVVAALGRQLGFEQRAA